MPISVDFEVIVIGAGHNRLTAAGYLRKVGLLPDEPRLDIVVPATLDDSLAPNGGAAGDGAAGDTHN